MESNIRNPKGAGRKTIDGEARNINISIRFNDKEFEEISKIAKELNLPKTRLIRNLALSGLDDAKLLSKLGVLKGAIKLKDFKERLENPDKYKSIPGL